MMKLSDDRVTNLVKQDNLPYYSYIATCGDKIYLANRASSTVTCYTIKGETLWEYKDLSVLNDPWGVTVDTNYNAYVSSYNISTVAVVEPNGRQGRQLISGDDGLYDPTGIYLTNLRTVYWLLTAVDRLSFINCVKSCLSFRDIVLFFY